MSTTEAMLEKIGQQKDAVSNVASHWLSHVEWV